MSNQQMRMGRNRVVALLSTAVLAFMSAPVFADVVQITVRLDGAHEVPPVATAGTGLGNITVDLATGAVSGSVSFSDLTTPNTGAHIHIGAEGVNGPIIVPLLGDLVVTEGTMFVMAGSVLLPDQLAALRVDGLYINVHTTANLGGEIRGQIRFADARSLGSVDEVALTEVVGGNFDPMRMGDELAGLGAEGSIFFTLDLMSWMEIPGDFITLVHGDFNGDGVDDLGGVSREDGSITITTDFGLTWMTIALPRK